MAKESDSEYGDALSTAQTLDFSRQPSAYSSAWSEQDHAEHEAVERAAREAVTRRAASPLPPKETPIEPACEAGGGGVASTPEMLPTDASAEADTLHDALNGDSDSMAVAAANESESESTEADNQEDTAATDSAAAECAEAAAQQALDDEPAPVLEQHLPPTAIVSQQHQHQRQHQQAAFTPSDHQQQQAPPGQQAQHTRHASSISFGSLASDSQLETLGDASAEEVEAEVEEEEVGEAELEEHAAVAEAVAGRPAASEEASTSVAAAPGLVTGGAAVDLRVSSGGGRDSGGGLEHRGSGRVLSMAAAFEAQGTTLSPKHAQHAQHAKQQSQAPQPGQQEQEQGEQQQLSPWQPVEQLQPVGQAPASASGSLGESEEAPSTSGMSPTSRLDLRRLRCVLVVGGESWSALWLPQTILGCDLGAAAV